MNSNKVTVNWFFNRNKVILLSAKDVMRKLSMFALALQITLPSLALGAVLFDSTKPRFKITLFTISGNRIKGVLLKTSSDNVSLYPGKFAHWKRRESIAPITTPVESIREIHLKKRNGLLKGALIGIGIGISPVLISSAFGRGEGGAYISIVALPLGLILGSIIGITSKKKYTISGNRDQLARLSTKLK